jgi:hypothetical protein
MSSLLRWPSPMRQPRNVRVLTGSRAVLIPLIQNEPIVDPNCVLGQALRPARKRPGSRSRGAYEARGATRNFRTEVGSSTRRHAASRRPVLSSGEANGWLLARDLRS